MPASKPTSLAGVTVQTDHANYANLVACYSFLDLSGTTITDSQNSNNLTLNTASWNGSTVPYGLALQHNHGAGDQIRATGGMSYSNGKSYTMFARFKVDAIDPTDNASAVVVSSANKYGNATISSSSTGITVDKDGDAHISIANNDVRRQWHDAPGTLGEGYITIAWVYDYTNDTFTGYRNGVEFSTLSPAPTQDPDPFSGERPGQFNPPNGGVWIGAGHNDDVGVRNGWNGNFDVLYIYDAALSAGDVLALHNDPYAVISASGGGSNGDWTESAVIGETTCEGLVCNMTVGGATPSGKPNTLGAVDLQTLDSLYTNVSHIWTFLDGSGTTVTDSVGSEDLTVTFNSTGAWNTTTEPEGLNLEHGGAGAQDVVKNTTLANPDEQSFSIHYRVKIDGFDGAGNVLAILGSNSYAGQGISWLADIVDNSPVLKMKIQDSAFQSRTVSGMNLTVGQWHNLVMTYSYATGKAAVLTGYVDGQKFVQETTNDDSPGQFGTIATGLLVNNTSDDDTQRGGQVKCDIIHYWIGRVLSDAEVTSITNEPYRLIATEGAVGGWEDTAVIGECTADGFAATFFGDGILANDSGEAPLRCIVSQQPTLGTITDWPGDGSFTYQAGSTPGTDTIKYIASYGGAQPAAEETITITVNAPPGGDWTATAAIGECTATGIACEITITGQPTGDFNATAVIGETDCEGLSCAMTIGAIATVGDINAPSWKLPANAGPEHGVKGTDYVYLPVWINRDNVVEIIVTEEGSAVDVNNVITKAEITLGSVSVNSDDNPEMFDWTVTDANGDNVLRLKLGDAVGLTVGTYFAKLVLYDAINTDGVVIVDDDSVTPLPIEVLEN